MRRGSCGAFAGEPSARARHREGGLVAIVEGAAHQGDVVEIFDLVEPRLADAADEVVGAQIDRLVAGEILGADQEKRGMAFATQSAQESAAQFLAILDARRAELVLQIVVDPLDGDLRRGRPDRRLLRKSGGPESGRAGGPHRQGLATGVTLQILETPSRRRRSPRSGAAAGKIAPR